ncbi:MAG: type II/IV secretion system ATPase subunit [Nitrososphaerota archaeon]|nr:type II/IV secretion system ATPase subunit [Nitrososphaerota archaeon]
MRALQFAPPRQGRVLTSYLVSYEVKTAGGLGYPCTFTVYIYESGGRCAYLVKEPYVDEALKAAVSSALESLSTWLAPSPVADLDPVGYLFAEMERQGLMKGMSREDAQSATYYLVRDILGYGILDPLLRDGKIEDVSCEGASRPVKVWHREVNANGWLETNVSFEEREDMDRIVSRLVHRSGKSISAYSPIVDSVLPEGFRLAATWGREVTSLGSSFRITKHSTEPFSIAELVRIGTLSLEVAAYLWMLLDLKGFVVVSGATATGKTTLLNSLASVMNPSWKIVSIEDTREINLPHSGWKPLHTRTLQTGASITLFDLVKLSLRERPDFVILGEARGQEVQALFQSAAAGSGCITTFHSTDLGSMTARMTQPPLSVSPSLLQLIDATVFMTKEPEGGRRYVHQVIETGHGMEPIFMKTEADWEGSLDSSKSLWSRAQAYGYSPKRLSAELERRKQFVSSLVGRAVVDYGTLSKELGHFYASPSFTL